NAGAIALRNGATLTSATAKPFSNSGDFTVDSGATFTLAAAPTFSNSGKVTVKGGATFTVAGDFINEEQAPPGQPGPVAYLFIGPGSIVSCQGEYFAQVDYPDQVELTID